MSEWDENITYPLPEKEFAEDFELMADEDGEIILETFKFPYHRVQVIPSNKDGFVKFGQFFVLIDGENYGGWSRVIIPEINCLDNYDELVFVTLIRAKRGKRING